MHSIVTMTVRLCEVLTVFLALHCCSHAAIFSEPSSQIAFEGEVSVFSCLSNGTLFWQIDGEFYDISRAVELKNRGFIFSDTYSNGMTDRSVSIVGSRETNNTVIMCVSVDDDNQVTVSGNATLTVLGSPANVSLTFSADSSLFRLSWESPSTPLGYEPHNYTMTISYKDGSTESNTIETILAMNGTDSYTFDYVVSDDLLPLSSCSQFVFSVVSSSVMGDSQPVTLTWENEKSAAGSIETTVCQLQLNDDGSTTALAVFTFPDLCPYQTLSYSFSLSLADTDSDPVVESDTRHFVGGARKEVRGQLVNLKLDLRSYYQVSVSGQLDNGDTLTGPGSVCTLTDFSLGTVDTGSLSIPTDDQSSLLVGIVIGSVFLFLTLAVYGILLIAVLVKRRK